MNSRFECSLLGLIGVNILAWVIIVLTFGKCYNGKLKILYLNNKITLISKSG